MGAKSVRMQQLKTVTSSSAQPVDQAVDLLNQGSISLRVQIVSASLSAGYLVFQDSPSLDASSFKPVKAIHLNPTRSENVVLFDTQRYLRWSVEGLAGTSPSVSFIIDLIGRC